MKRKIGYLIFTEGIWEPIIQTQVKELLSNLTTDNDIYLIWFYPIYFLFRHRNKIIKSNIDYKTSKIKLIKLPVLFIPKTFATPWFLTKIYQIQIALGIVLVSIFFRIRYFHCRAYHTAYGVELAKKVLTKVKFIFDPRSPFPEENVSASNWSKESYSYKKWKNIEGKIINNSDVIVATSESFKNQFEKEYDIRNIMVIPNNVSTIADYNDIKTHKTIVISYEGSIGTHWNKIDTYCNFVKLINFYVPEIFFNFIIPYNNINLLQEGLDKNNISNKIYKIESCMPNEVISRLVEYDFGVNIMDNIDTRMSIKTAEYLAAGLPIIVSENVKGAADIVSKYDVGFILKSDYSNILDLIEYIKNNFNNIELRKKCVEVCKNNFSTQKIAIDYNNIYNLIFK